MTLKRPFRATLSCVAICVLIASIGCGSGQDREDQTPVSDPAALELANSVLLAQEDVGEGWEELPDSIPTPVNAADTGALFGQAFNAWAGCVGGVLSGGFVGLGRLATVSTPRFADGSGRLVAGGAAVFTLPDRAEQVVAQLAESREGCSALGRQFAVESAELDFALAEAETSYRLSIVVQMQSGRFEDTFDLVVLRRGAVISSVVFKGFGADDSGQADIIQRAAAKLP